MYATFWALVPPIVAIALALITKEVYSSLFIGILVGGLFYSNFSFVGTLEHIFTDGMIAQLSDAYNVGILLFLVFLGIMVSLMNKAGGSAAFGEWASKHIKTRVGAQLATIALGCLIFIDDYFNCLTVGSVMRPVTDRHQVSRAKLAYLIDATAAPVCIIAPISSWAAAVSAFAPEGTNGLVLFIRAIPYNYYALFTLVMMITLTVLKIEYGPMLKYEKNAMNGDIFTFPQTLNASQRATGYFSLLGVPNGCPGLIVHGAVLQVKTHRVPQWIAQAEGAIFHSNVPAFLQRGFSVSRAGKAAIPNRGILQVI
jgi:Na+/H+ antiporter NhaC